MNELKCHIPEDQRKHSLQCKCQTSQGVLQMTSVLGQYST